MVEGSQVVLDVGFNTAPGAGDVNFRAELFHFSKQFGMDVNFFVHVKFLFFNGIGWDIRSEPLILLNLFDSISKSWLNNKNIVNQIFNFV